jgi:hypothetical protein
VADLTKQLSTSPAADAIIAYDNEISSKDRQIIDIEQKLENARKHHTPTMRHFEAIEYNMKDLEMRQSKVRWCDVMVIRV